MDYIIRLLVIIACRRYQKWLIDEIINALKLHYILRIKDQNTAQDLAVFDDISNSPYFGL